MRSEDFVRAMGQIDEKYVEEALKYKPVSRNMRIWKAVAIAACAVLAVSAAFAAFSMNNGSKSLKNDTGSNFYYSAEEISGETGYDGAAQEQKSSAAVYDMDDGTAVYDDYDMAYEEFAYEEMADETYAVTAGQNIAAVQGAAEDDAWIREKKVIYNVYMDMQTKEFDAVAADLESIVYELGGYFENQDIYNTQNQYRSAGYTLRIPAENLDEFLDRAGQISTVTYMSRSARDVSDSYYDTQSRLDSARTKLSRLQDLMAEAENMEDLITIESAITDVEWEIDNYGSTVRYYDSQVSYSTVTLNLKEVYEIEKVTEPPMTFGERVGNAFEQGFNSVGMFLKNFVIWLAASWIWILLIVIAVIIVIALIERKKNKKKEK